MRPGRWRRGAVVAVAGLLACRSVIGFEDGVATKPNAELVGATADATRDLGTPADATVSDAFAPDAENDGSTSGGGFVDLGPNLLAGATVTATDTFSQYLPAALVDGKLDTSWYAPEGACVRDASPDYACDGVSITIRLAAPQTVARVKLFGPRDRYRLGYNVLKATIVLLGVTGDPLYQETVLTTRGAEPDGDAEVRPPHVEGVQTIRVDVIVGQASAPGLGEIAAYGK